ncbi:MAG: hypothetical protein HY867_18240 [Chloroflexi bacterium]|nr:hypothetical protein [Chloroflexota bacterium]
MNKRNSLTLIVLLLIAGAFLFALTRSAPSETDNDRLPQPALTEEPLVIAITPSVESSGPCAYTWAYHDLPEVSAEFEAAVKALLPDASAHASAFGEDCVSADGRAVSFSAMETDFYVVISVTDLNDNEALGNLIAQVLPALDHFAIGSVPGPKDGFIEFTFRAGEDQRVVRVPLPLGREFREKGVSGAELIGAIEQP